MTKIVSLNTFKTQTKQNTGNLSYSTTRLHNENISNNNLKGVILNNFIKENNKNNDFSDFDEISSLLLIPENSVNKNIKDAEKKEQAFSVKNAIKPLAATFGAILASSVFLSSIVKNYSKTLVSGSGVIRPPDLARNINILEEPHFAFYQALRDPSTKKILGFAGVGIMSVLVVAGRNFIEGLKEVWVKKQACDIERDLQKNLINVEAEAFSGKLNVVNTLLKDSTRYFKEVLSSKKDKNTNFKSFLIFQGDKNKEENNDNIKLNKKNILFLSAITLGLTGISVLLYKNATKTFSNLKEFMDKFSDKEIRASINKAVELSKAGKKEQAIENLNSLFKVTNATEENMQKEFEKISNITNEEIKSAIKDIKNSQIYVKAPEAMGGVSEKIQYYCYINEERGHLYNWILNPENKFNKYIFSGFSAISLTGYILNTTATAIKDVTVGKQNAKNELNLRKQLVDIEIENFKAKKLNAINPLIDNFNYQMKKGKSKQELKTLAENILYEIKNGPPYVYS